jgi:hypothetical protein
VTYGRLAYADLIDPSEMRSILKRGAEGVQSLRSIAGGKDGSQLFATGPSLGDIDAAAVVREGALRIVCNSVVSNPELLRLIDPHVLTFGDAAFHFGHSEYASQFRRDVLAALEAHPSMLVVVPAEFVRLMPGITSVHGNRVVPLPISRPGATDVRALWHRGSMLRTGNIMTMAMLPLAVFSPGAVELFGFDGRAPTDSGFWKHSSAAQYDALYESVRVAHPAFFSERDFVKYYDKHCVVVARMVGRLEKLGHPVRVLTKSYIPALETRYVEPSSR